MIALFVYLGIGLALAFAFRTNDGKRAIASPLVGSVIISMWPIVLLFVLPRISALKYRGKTLWKRDGGK